jgi:hypothetical protein
MAVTIDGVGEINGVVLPTTSFGKVLQVVRATDTTERSTTSATLVDASISVTITPQKSTSAILLIWSTPFTGNNTSGATVTLAITDSSNNAISGAEQTRNRAAQSNDQFSSVTLGYATPATTSATTYKGRFVSFDGGTVSIRNDLATGQLFAIEVSA